MHKLILALLLATTISNSVNAQDKPEGSETQYLFKDSGSKGVTFSTFYGEMAPSTAFSSINNTLGKLFLTEFGVHLNRKFGIGYYLARSLKTTVVNVPLPTEPEYQDWIDNGVRLDQLPTGATQAFVSFTHSGLNLSYMHKTEKVLFWRAGIRYGFGKLELTTEKKQLFGFFNTSIFESKVTNINPEIGLGVNLRSWWRLHLDIGYHFVFANSDQIIDSSKFDGTTFKFGFAFGDFSR